MKHAPRDSNAFEESTQTDSKAVERQSQKHTRSFDKLEIVVFVLVLITSIVALFWSMRQLTGWWFPSPGFVVIAIASACLFSTLLTNYATDKLRVAHQILFEMSWATLQHICRDFLVNWRMFAILGAVVLFGLAWNSGFLDKVVVESVVVVLKTCCAILLKLYGLPFALLAICIFLSSTRWGFYRPVRWRNYAARTGFFTLMPAGSRRFVLCLGLGCLIAVALIRLADDGMRKRIEKSACDHVERCLSHRGSRIAQRQSEVSDALSKITKMASSNVQPMNTQVAKQMKDVMDKLASNPEQLESAAANEDSFWKQFEKDSEAFGNRENLSSALKSLSASEQKSFATELLNDLRCIFEITQEGKIECSKEVKKLCEEEASRTEVESLMKAILYSKESVDSQSNLYHILVYDYVYPKPYEVAARLKEHFCWGDSQLQEDRVRALFTLSMTFPAENDSTEKVDSTDKVETETKWVIHPSEWVAPGGDIARLLQSGRVLDLIQGRVLEPMNREIDWPLGLTTVRLREMMRGVIQTLTIMLFAWGLCVLAVSSYRQFSELAFVPIRRVEYELKSSSIAYNSGQTWYEIWNNDISNAKLDPRGGSGDLRVQDITDSATQTNKLVPMAIAAALRTRGLGGTKEESLGSAAEVIVRWRERCEQEHQLLQLIAASMPNLGFVGTIIGIGQGLAVAYSIGLPSSNPFHKAEVIAVMTSHLGTAFYTTLVALLCATPFYFLMLWLQRLSHHIAELVSKKIAAFVIERVL